MIRVKKFTFLLAKTNIHFRILTPGFLSIIFSCEVKSEKSADLNKNETKDITQSKITIENKKYYVGDFNSDKRNDTAYIT